MVENKDLALREAPMSPAEVSRQVARVQQVMKAVMKEEEHYGKIPGCGDKPALFKPGAEKLLMTFRFYPEYEELAGTREDEDFICYKIRCVLRHIPTDRIVGSGMGTCNSREKKYKTRSVYPNKATEEEKAIGKEEKRRGKENRDYTVLIVPQDPWDLQNTLYKMACKRALIAATLNATAASDIFAQDIEDYEGYDLEGDQGAPEKTVTMPKAKKPVKKGDKTQQAPPAQGQDGNGMSTLGQQKALHSIFNKLYGKTGDDQLYKILGGLGFESTKELSMKQAGDLIEQYSKEMGSGSQA